MRGSRGLRSHVDERQKFLLALEMVRRKVLSVLDSPGYEGGVQVVLNSQAQAPLDLQAQRALTVRPVYQSLLFFQATLIANPALLEVVQVYCKFEEHRGV